MASSEGEALCAKYRAEGGYAVVSRSGPRSSIPGKRGAFTELLRAMGVVQFQTTDMRVAPHMRL
eukprot:6171895-Pleurochrysis_carterae.AAC.2